MVQDPPRISGERKELPIERSFPIERVNEIAAKEGRAKMYYRPIYTMHKWWARRPGCVFRAITLYSLVDDSEGVEVHEPGEDGTLGNFGGGHSNIENLIENVGMATPESLWELYQKDVRVDDKKILDPFMGGGTSLVEASRFGIESVGYDLNPVAWFISKKQLDAGKTDIEELEDAFNRVEDDVADEIKQYYRTPCPNGDHQADVVYSFWVKEVDCTSCENTVSLFNDYRIANGRYKNKGLYNVWCPGCQSIILTEDWRSEITCPEEGYIGSHECDECGESVDFNGETKNICSECGSSVTPGCGHEYTPQEGTADGSDYVCRECGARYGITDAIQEQNGFDLRLHATEYYCKTCEEAGSDRDVFKGYKPAGQFDQQLFEKAKQEWDTRNELREYIPENKIPPGHMTSERNPVFDHGYEEWIDMFNTRQLLCLSILLKSIDRIENANLKEHLLLAFTNCLNTNSQMVNYVPQNNAIGHMFKTNSFDPQMRPVETNLWGSEEGKGNYQSMYDLIKSGVEYAHAPTERYPTPDGMEKSKPFQKPIGEDATVQVGDAKSLDHENEFDAVITDPPYYDNIMYSEVSDYFYVWQKILLENDYEYFDYEKTPRNESIVTNPFLGKTADDFENEIEESFAEIKRALKDDGVLAFTYHHSSSESWGELLEALCDAGFEVTATYPITADLHKFIKGTAVSFDIIIVARPAGDRNPISWNSLRRDIVRTAKQTHQRLTENRELSEGNIGVIEMGRAFHEYSKHHGEVRKGGEIMTAKEVVDEIYGIIQQGSDIGEVDVFLDLLEMNDPSYSDLNMLTRGTSANSDTMGDNLLYQMDAGEFVIGTWDNEKRQAYIQERVNSDGDDELTPLDKAQFLRYRYEQGKSIQNYLEKWTVSNDLRELCGELAEASGDDVYNRLLGGDRTLGDY